MIMMRYQQSRRKFWSFLFVERQSRTERDLSPDPHFCQNVMYIKTKPLVICTTTITLMWDSIHNLCDVFSYYLNMCYMSWLCPNELITFGLFGRCEAELELFQVGPEVLGRFIATGGATGLCQWVRIRRSENVENVFCRSGAPIHRTYYCIVPPLSPPADCLVSRRPVTSGPPRGEEQKREACTERELTPRKAGQEKGSWFDKKDCRGAENGVDGRKDLGRWTSLESWKKSEFSIMEA